MQTHPFRHLFLLGAFPGAVLHEMYFLLISAPLPPIPNVSYSTNPSQQFQPLMTLSAWAPTSYRAILISDTIILLNVRQLFLSQHKSRYFSAISVFSTASSQHTDSKYLLNETNIKPVENKSQDWKKIWNIIQINSLPKCFYFPTCPSEMNSAWITPGRGNSLPHKTSTFKKC